MKTLFLAIIIAISEFIASHPNLLKFTIGAGAASSIEMKAQNPLYLNSTINTTVPSWDVSFLYTPSKYVVRMEDSTNCRLKFSNIYLEKQPLTSAGTPSTIAWVSGDGKLNVSPISSLTNAIASTTLSAGTGISITGSSSSYTVAFSKRHETYSGTTNASGTYSVTFSTPFSVAPNVQASIPNQSNTNQFIRVTSVTTTGFLINVFQRNSINLLGTDVLLFSTANVNGAPVDVLVIEK